MSDKRTFGRWEKTCCDVCGDEFQVTRTEPKETDGPVICGDCEMYERGYNDAQAHAAEQVKKARRDVIDQANTALMSMWSDTTSPIARAAIADCARRVRQLMEEEG